MLLSRHALLDENLSARQLLYKLLIRGFSETLKTAQANAIALGCPL